VCKPGFWEKAMYRKVTRVTGHLCQVLGIRNDAANRWQTQQKRMGVGGSGGEWGGGGRGKNPRQGGSLDKDKGQDRQYNYEQARSTSLTQSVVFDGLWPILTMFPILLVYKCAESVISQVWPSIIPLWDASSSQLFELTYGVVKWRWRPRPEPSW